MANAETTLLVGSPRIGKTTFAAAWCADRNGILIETDPGGAEDANHDTKIQVTSLEDLRQMLPRIIAEARPVALDPLDQVYRWVQQDITAQRKTLAAQASGREKKPYFSFGDDSYGGDWSEARERILNVLFAFQVPEILVAANTHADNPMKLALPGQLATVIPGVCSNVLVATIQGPRRIAYVGACAQVPVTGSRGLREDAPTTIDVSYEAWKAHCAQWKKEETPPVRTATDFLQSQTGTQASPSTPPVHQGPAPQKPNPPGDAEAQPVAPPQTPPAQPVEQGQGNNGQTPVATPQAGPTPEEGGPQQPSGNPREETPEHKAKLNELINMVDSMNISMDALSRALEKRGIEGYNPQLLTEEQLEEMIANLQKHQAAGS